MALDSRCSSLLASLLATSALVTSCRHLADRDASATLDAPRSRDVAGEPGAPDRANPSFYGGPFTIDGDYTLDPAGIAAAYGGVAVERFGSTRVSARGPGSPTWLVRDMHYHLGNGRVGIRPFPVLDRSAAGDDQTSKTVDGKPVAGSKALDAYLRQVMGLAPSDPIFAVIAYMHPEQDEIALADVAAESTKLENGVTHMGGYLGEGQTRNAPYEYHRLTWEVTGYPANVSIVRLDDVPQATLNANARIVLRLLNEANGHVRMPFDPRLDPMATTHLGETLDFFRAWLDPAWVRSGETTPYQQALLSDPSLETYCAEHLTIALTVALNVPQNEVGYVDVWGDVEGKKLFALAREQYRRVTRRDLGGAQDLPTVAPFPPLWRQLGLTAPEAAKAIGDAMVWRPEAIVDLISSFVEQYASWTYVGGARAASAGFAFADAAHQRIGVTPERFLALATPIVTRMLEADATTRAFAAAANAHAAFTAFVDDARQELEAGLAHAKLSGTPAAAALVATALKALTDGEERLVRAPPVAVPAAYEAFRAAVRADLAAARDEATVAGPGVLGISRYVSAAIAQRVASNIYPDLPHVHIVTVATAMDPAELRSNPAGSVTLPVSK